MFFQFLHSDIQTSINTIVNADKSHSERGRENETPASEAVKNDLFMFPVNIANYLNLKV